MKPRSGTPGANLSFRLAPEAGRGCYTGRGGGPWLCRTFLPSGLRAVVIDVAA
jgi:hypothetical protein